MASLIDEVLQLFVSHSVELSGTLVFVLVYGRLQLTVLGLHYPAIADGWVLRVFVVAAVADLPAAR